MSYLVTLRADDGREVTVSVSASSDERACSAAVRAANRNYGRRGWLAIPYAVTRVAR